jgi:molecular chaperone GrpE
MNDELHRAPTEAGPGESPALEGGQPSAPRFKVSDRRFWTLDQAELESEPERPRMPSYIEQLERQLADRDKQLREYIAAYKREVGEELEKTKQRLQRDASQRIEQVRGELALPMLEVLDALERALPAAMGAADSVFPQRPLGREDRNPVALVQGLRMVHLLMVQKLQEVGLTRVQTAGARFDPARHEAAAVVPVDVPALDGAVVAEIKPGFLLGERLLRPALVQVGKLAQ